MQSYLDHHGDKLSRRFDANTYVVLTRTMITHDLGRDRGGVDGGARVDHRAGARHRRRLRPAVPARAVRADRGRHPRRRSLRTIHSDYGHDGFLIEEDLVGAYVHEFLEQGARR